MVERRRRILSDDDLKEIRDEVIKAVKSQQVEHPPHCCFFDEDTRGLLKVLSKVYGEARSALLKGVIALLLIGGLLFMALGAGIIKSE